MKVFLKRIVYLYLIVYTLILVFYLSDIISLKFLYSSLLAGFVNALNAVAATKLFQISYKKSSSSFLMYNLGGSGIRLLVLLTIMVITIKFLNIDQYGFIFIFFLFYFSILILEVLFYIKTIKKTT